jgi:hypothetical protein
LIAVSFFVSDAPQLGGALLGGRGGVVAGDLVVSTCILALFYGPTSVCVFRGCTVARSCEAKVLCCFLEFGFQDRVACTGSGISCSNLYGSWDFAAEVEIVRARGGASRIQVAH